MEHPLLLKDRGAPSATDYRKILVAARRRQLEVSRENLGRLEATFNAAAESLAGQLLNVPGYMLDEEGAIRQAFLRQIIQSLDATLANLRQDYGALLDVGLLEGAQAAADRQAAVEALMTSSAAKDPHLEASLRRLVSLSDGSQVTAAFGRTALGAVEALARRIYGDGLKLSDRLYNLDQGARKVVEDTIVQGVAEQVSAVHLAERLQESLAAAGADNPRYQAMRIARTEINNAHREASVRAALDPETGEMKDFLAGVRWNLSLSHQAPDICDVWAAHDEGAGEGIYSPASVPVDHPHGLCFVTMELKAFPGVSGPGKEPDVEGVPDSQVDYYAEQGDAAAQARQNNEREALRPAPKSFPFTAELGFGFLPILAKSASGGHWVTIHGHAVLIGDHAGGGSGGGGKSDAPAEKEPGKSAKSILAKQTSRRVGAEVQRYSEEYCEPILAKGVGGVSLPDTEPMDVLVHREGVIAHGIELKTMTDNKNRKLTVEKDALERKINWVKENHAPGHMVVFDDHKVFNANGAGEHDDSKREIYYKRGFGSFRVNAMHKVEGGLKELGKLLDTPDKDLPAAAKPPKTYPGVTPRKSFGPLFAN